jgi:hypothetical protein
LCIRDSSDADNDAYNDSGSRVAASAGKPNEAAE